MIQANKSPISSPCTYVSAHALVLVEPTTPMMSHKVWNVVSTHVLTYISIFICTDYMHPIRDIQSLHIIAGGF